MTSDKWFYIEIVFDTSIFNAIRQVDTVDIVRASDYNFIDANSKYEVQILEKANCCCYIHRNLHFCTGTVITPFMKVHI